MPPRQMHQCRNSLYSLQVAFRIRQTIPIRIANWNRGDWPNIPAPTLGRPVLQIGKDQRHPWHHAHPAALRETVRQRLLRPLQVGQSR